MLPSVAGEADPHDLLLAVSQDDAHAHPQFASDQIFTVGAERYLEGRRFRTAWITESAKTHPDHDALALLHANAALYGTQVRPVSEWTPDCG